jgi:hypothetical protein
MRAHGKDEQHDEGTFPAGVLYDWWPEIAAPTNYHQNGIKAYILHRLNYLAADSQKFGD